MYKTPTSIALIANLKFRLLLLFSCLAFTIKAQTPGPFYLTPLTMPPAGFSTSLSLTPSALGVGRVKAPDGWGEFRYCQQNSAPLEKGLIITREDCNPNSVGASSNDFIFNGEVELNPDPLPGTPQLSLVPIPYALGTIPFSYYSPLNPSGPNSPSPALNLRIGQQPMFQIRTVDYPSTFGSNSAGSIKSRFIVMPDGNSGINTEDPRAALDVQDANRFNTPVAIFGNVLPYSATNLLPRTNAGVAPINQTFTRHIAIVPRLKDYGFNMISHTDDIGLIFTNGLGVEGSNTNGALVIAPYTKDQNVGGLRIESNGNTELRGNFRCNKLTVNTKWWPDAVFAIGYRLMSLTQVDSFISVNRHLPGIPCEDSVISWGQDVGALQVLQQQKIEELTLYLINQEKQQRLQEKLISEQKNQLITQELRLQKLEAIINQK